MIGRYLAEFVGFFIGDGCLSKWKRKNRLSETKTILLEVLKETLKSILN